MSILSNLISLLKTQGIFEIYLPFLLTFSVFYALLMKSKIFGENKPGPTVSLIVALVAGIYVTIYTPFGVGLSEFFATFFAQSSVFLTLIIVIGITLAALATPLIFGEGFAGSLFQSTTSKLVLAGIVILVCLAMFASSLQKLPGFPGLNIGLSGDDIALILLLLATGLIIFWAQSGENEETKQAKEMLRRAKEEAKKKQQQNPV